MAHAALHANFRRDRAVSANGVLVLGEALIDDLPSGPVPGGAPFNVARSLAALGTPVTFVSRIGAHDEAGALVLQSARRFGLADGGIQRDPLRGTGRVSVLQRGDDHVFEIEPHSAWDHIDTAQAWSALPSTAPQVIYFGTLSQRHETSKQTIAKVLAATDGLRLLDLNLRAPFTTQALAAYCLHLADWVKVNLEELVTVLAWFVPHAQLEKDFPKSGPSPAVAALMRHFSLNRLIVTLGERGWASFAKNGHCDHCGPAFPVAKITDTVGAGDAFTAMFLAMLCRSGALGIAPCKSWAGQLQTALAMAAQFGAAICEQRGPMPHDDRFFPVWVSRIEAAVQSAATATQPVPHIA